VMMAPSASQQLEPEVLQQPSAVRIAAAA